MKYKGVIFDLDGVICSTDHYHYLAWKALADRLGAYFDETINNRLRGVSRMASLDIVLERYDGTLSEEEKIAAAEEKSGGEDQCGARRRGRGSDENQQGIIP